MLATTVYKHLKAVLKAIMTDGDFTEAEEIRKEILTFVKPHAFGGKDGIEVAIEKDYQNTRLVVSKNYNIDIAEMSALQYLLTVEKLKKDGKPNKNK